MRDLVESVIDNLLYKERMQQAGKARPSADNKSQFKQTMEDIQSQARPSGQQGVQVPHQSEHSNKKLWQASLQFEGQFIQQMMAAMRKSIPKSGFLAHGFAEDVQGSMMDRAIADATSRRGDLGIATAVYRQMTRASGGGAQEIPATADIDRMVNSLDHPVDQTTEVNRHAR